MAATRIELLQAMPIFGAIRDDALRFLLEAQAVAQKCADSAERPLPQKQLHTSDHAFAGQHNELS